MIHIYDSEVDNLGELIKQKDIIILYFSAIWCGPCKRMHKPLEELSELHSNEVVIIKIDVDEYPEISDDLEIKSLPTFLFFKSGEINCKTQGANLDEFKSNLYSLL